MADLNIRNIDEKLLHHLKADAAANGTTLRQRCIDLLSAEFAGKPHKDLLDQAIDRAPKDAVAVSLVTEQGTVIETRAIPARSHNKATCRIYGCLLCNER